jgi:hypothetical protein
MAIAAFGHDDRSEATHGVRVVGESLACSRAGMGQQRSATVCLSFRDTTPGVRWRSSLRRRALLERCEHGRPDPRYDINDACRLVEQDKVLKAVHAETDDKSGRHT